eukprot:25906_1
MQGLDWEDIIKIDDEGDDVIYLPQPEVTSFDASGQFQKEISYEWEDPNDKTSIIRREKKSQIIEMKKKISTAAISRRTTWKKFGAVSNEPKGSLEKGITSHRPDDVPFLWNGMSLEKINKKKAARRRDLTKQQKQKKNLAAIMAEEEEKEKKPSNVRRTYQVKKDFAMDEMFEIRCSNLPDWTEWAHIKELIDAFYRNFLNVRYPPKYKIRMFTTKFEQEKNAIVEFENE